MFVRMYVCEDVCVWLLFEVHPRVRDHASEANEKRLHTYSQHTLHIQTCTHTHTHELCQRVMQCDGRTLTDESTVTDD